MGRNSGENSALAGECFIYFGDELFAKEDKKMAKKIFIKAFNIIKFCSNINDKVIYVAAVIACIFFEKNQSKQCEKWLSYFFNSNIDLNLEPKTKIYLASTLLDMGIKFAEENCLNKAEKYLLKVNEFYKNKTDETKLIHYPALNALGLIYEKKNDFRKAEEYILKAFNMAKNSQAEPEEIAAMAGNLVRIYGLLHDNKREADYYEIHCRYSKI